MNNKEFIAELAQRTGYTQADTQKLVNALIEGMGNSFESGENVAMTGFGAGGRQSLYGTTHARSPQIGFRF